MTDADIHAHPPGSRLRSALRSSVGLFKSFNPFNSPGRSGANPHLLDVGTVLRHYVIDEVVSHDDVVATYHGHSTSTDREVVIREFLPASCSTRAGDLSIAPRADDDGGLFNSGLSHFIREGEIVRDLQHPNVMQVLDVFAANHTAYVVMPRERGERLDARRARLGALQDRELVDLAIGVLSGFERLHEAGIVHGQFSETSVVHSDAGVPVIQFFDGAGLATLRKRIRQVARNGTGVRPGIDEVRPSVDLYSLSQMLERLSRRPAGEGRAEEVTRASDFHRPEVLAAMGRALSPDAEQRPDSAARWKMEFEHLRRQLKESDVQGAEPAAVEATPAAAELADLELPDEPAARTVPSLIGAARIEPSAAGSDAEMSGGAPAAEEVAAEEVAAEEVAAEEVAAEEVAAEEVAAEEVAAEEVAAEEVAAEEVAAVASGPAAGAEPVSSGYVEPPEAATIAQFPGDPVVAAAGEEPAERIERTEPVTTLIEAERPPQLTLADTVVLVPQAVATGDEQAPPQSAAAGPRQPFAQHDRAEQLQRRRIAELESHLRERDALLERAAAHLRQYDAAMKQSRLVFMQRDQREKILRARLADLEAQLAERAAAANRNEHGESQGGSTSPPAQGDPLQHVSQAQLVEMREALAAEFARNATTLQMARQEAQAAEAARQRLAEQTELVLADYRNRNCRIRAHEEARILEERRLLEVERDYLRSALQTANVAREQAEQMARKAIEQADRLRNLTTAQIASAEAAVYADLKLVRSGAAPVTQVLAHEAVAPESAGLVGAPVREGREGRESEEAAKIA
ncbi:MAG: hypothetical protein HONDAALG_02448 [Gammaproteobacteria bacterium]|nr:hypothetical protein [Gammaproteobacteria bacterium]